MEEYENEYSQEYGDIPYSKKWETYLVPLFFAVIYVAGVVSNATLVYTSLRDGAMRTVPITLLASVALGDLVVIMSCIPFTSTIYAIESWPYGELICKVSEGTKDISTGVTVFTLTALRVGRYGSIVNAISNHLSTKATTVVTVLAIWLLSIVIASPTVIFSNVQTVVLNNNSTIHICSQFPLEYGETYQKSAVLLMFVSYLTGPLCIIGVSYVLMARHLIISIKILSECRGHNISNQIKKRKKTAKIVLAYIIIFIICFLPSHAFSLWLHFYPEAPHMYKRYYHVLIIVTFCLGLIHSCINPIALYLISKEFRQLCNSYLLCCVIRSEQVTLSDDPINLNLYA